MDLLATEFSQAAIEVFSRNVIIFEIDSTGAGLASKLAHTVVGWIQFLMICWTKVLVTHELLARDCSYFLL